MLHRLEGAGVNGRERRRVLGRSGLQPKLQRRSDATVTSLEGQRFRGARDFASPKEKLSDREVRQGIIVVEWSRIQRHVSYSWSGGAHWQHVFLRGRLGGEMFYRHVFFLLSNEECRRKKLCWGGSGR